MFRISKKATIRPAASYHNQISKIAVIPPLSMAFSTSRSRIIPNDEKAEITANLDSVTLNSDELKPGFSGLQKRLQNLSRQAGIAAIASPAISGGWLLATGQLLKESPVALTALLVGGCFIADRLMQTTRVKQYTSLSVLTNKDGPASSALMNQRIQQILAGNNPSVKFSMKGLTVSGPLGDIQNPSSATQHALSRIYGMNRIVLPNCVLSQNTAELANLATQRWSARLSVPFSIINLFAIASKSSEEKTPDDYVVGAASAYNLYNYFDGPSVAEARDKFTSSLSPATSSENLASRVVDNSVLYHGGMSFLNTWAKDQKSIAVRVARTGDVVLYNNRQSSFGGPYPIQLFPMIKPDSGQDKKEERNALPIQQGKSLSK
jgi:hypothetical protein